MYNNISQIYTFIATVALGVVAGLLYEPCGLLKKGGLTCKILGGISDVLFFILLVFIYILTAFYLKFDRLRFFYILGIGVGFLLWRKSFHYYLQMFYKRYIISITEKIKRRKLCRKKKRKK